MSSTSEKCGAGAPARVSPVRRSYCNRRLTPPDFVMLAINGGSYLLQTRIMSRNAETNISAISAPL